ncbi:MAG: hypothetical protein ABSG23_00575 [Terriglobales bacterium]|jgi:hypothetical protein
MTDLWIQRLTEEFWQAAGVKEPLPRNLESPVLWALPVAIVKVPRLRLSDARYWLEQRQMLLSVDEVDRDLHACLIAFAGRGLIFLDGQNPIDELRFSLAHEVGHFIVDYLVPRRTAMARFGPDIANVLDGHRPATIEERGAAILSNTTIGVYRHMMTRMPSGAIGCSRIAEAENAADQLALELLAPVELVRESLAENREPAKQSHHEITTVLKERFGLPNSVAVRYSFRFGPADKKPKSVREWLGMC